MTFVLLCVLGLLNPAVAQVGYLLLPGGIAGLSLMQWFQGAAFLFELMLIPFIHRSFSSVRSLQHLATFFSLGILVFISKTMLEQGVSSDVTRAEAIEYSKFAFWAVTWLCIALCVRTPTRARILLICILVGISVDAIFKLVGFGTGQWSVASYGRAGVSASFGAEGISGKATVGFLIPCVFLVWHVLRSWPWMGAFLSVIFVAAIAITYDRAAQVSMVASLLWCMVWSLANLRRSGGKSTFVRFLIFLIVGGIFFAQTLGLEPLTARWKYELKRSGTITGSGRTAFYATTWEWFKSAEVLDQLFGQGIQRTLDMIGDATGEHVHTHSDLFDCMSYGGALGLALYSYLLYVLFSLMCRIPHFFHEFQIAGAILVGFIVMSLTTGQFGATHAMLTVGASIWCLQYTVGSHNRVHLAAEPILSVRARQLRPAAAR